MDIIYLQPFKELLQLTSYFKEDAIVLVKTLQQEQAVKKIGFIPCHLINEKSKQPQKIKTLKAVMGGSVSKNDFAVKIKSDFLLQPANEKQFFDLGLAKNLSDNNTTVVFMLGDFLKKNSFERHLYWKNYLEVVKHCNKKKTKFLVASGCEDPLLLRPQKVRKSFQKLLNVKYEKEFGKGV